VSKDPLITSIVPKYKIDIVISSSGLVALVSLQASLNIELELPVHVVESKSCK
jgi:UDP-N-acetylglucosamine:LPS N-acetylglucosamine transferase